LISAVEVCLLTGAPFSAQRTQTAATMPGVFLYRDRADLYQRIDRRVEQMFEAGVVEEVRALSSVGQTAEKTLGLREIQMLLAGEISQQECIAKIQQATRRYAKRQLTWFRRQSNLEPLNLSSHGFSAAIDSIAQSASRVFANG
jgi:tRNA dimethylallyltransferase